jgi:hypothetical protein
LELIQDENNRVKVYVKKGDPGCCASNKITVYMENIGDEEFGDEPYE